MPRLHIIANLKSRASIMHTLIVCFICILLVPFSRAVDQVCHRGTILYTPLSGPDVCIPCTDGVNFMPNDWHSMRQCYDCTQIDNSGLEIIHAKCNRTHDTEILCKEGFYRRKARNIREKDTCVKCYKCDFPTRPCEGYDDTVCCQPGYDAVKNKDGLYVCQEQPIICGQGQYFNVKTEQCLPCEEGSYMQEDNHKNRECTKCLNESLHEIIINHCNRTHPPTFTCVKGYYRDGQGNCSQCMSCVQEEWRHDAACCPSGVVDVDSESRPSYLKPNREIENLQVTTESSETECMIGQYFRVNKDGSVTGVARFDENHHQKVNHTRITYSDYCITFTRNQFLQTYKELQINKSSVILDSHHAVVKMIYHLIIGLSVFLVL